MKYHLGCGSKRLASFINVDCTLTEAVDIVDDISTLNSLENGTADLIYACHCLEHFGRNEVKDVLKTWHSKLKSGGLIRIAVPDFDAVVKFHSEHGTIDSVLGLVCGGQRDQYDYHKMIFTFDSLKRLLEEAGFTDVKKYNWRETEHSDIDDYSQSYLPQMHKDTGRLMSLNVEAKKRFTHE